MKFEPQCKTLADLHREWARVLDMCEWTEAMPWDGWKYNGKRNNWLPIFHTPSEPTLYEFSIGIIEGKHVFRGDILCCHGREAIIDGYINNLITGVFEDGLAARYPASKTATSINVGWSRNPPKQEPTIPEGFTNKITKRYRPETVMVELPMHTVAYYATQNNPNVAIVEKACHKALEREKLL